MSWFETGLEPSTLSESAHGVAHSGPKGALRYKRIAVVDPALSANARATISLRTIVTLRSACNAVAAEPLLAGPKSIWRSKVI
ncbi:hypothetical protein OQ968_03350 [Mycobacterium sp. 663a-19]|uniref:hypothetical protein n=1 Tax=Mycobacterium sp. 663a-19 TaxID=2986148 RepID=UPI002D1EF7A6|nr:hypothetical protein [Mycobacterium sp. 663a-19]MEB3980295.1 hypothetical protein [Mycobacterium sp. 663a-19]